MIDIKIAIETHLVKTCRIFSNKNIKKIIPMKTKIPCKHRITENSRNP
jgi:ribosomal protein L16/L10AE